MDNFKAVYKILTALEKAMDLPEFDINQIGYEALGVSKERWARYIEMMVDVGYIKGVRVGYNINGDTMVEAHDMRITLKGLEYLQEDSIMQKLYKSRAWCYRSRGGRSDCCRCYSLTLKLNTDSALTCVKLRTKLKFVSKF